MRKFSQLVFFTIVWFNNHYNSLYRFVSNVKFLEMEIEILIILQTINISTESRNNSLEVNKFASLFTYNLGPK